MAAEDQKKDWNVDLSCDNFPTDSTTSSGAGGDFVCKGPEAKAPVGEHQSHSTCSPILMSSSTSTSSLSAMPIQIFHSECLLVKAGEQQGAPNLSYELSLAKSIMQQYSTISGDNLFDHLSDIIKRVIDERPPNIIDFFEEFSRNVREQKFHLPERFPPNTIYEETRLYRMAKRQLLSMKLPYDEVPPLGQGEDLAMEEEKSTPTDDLHLELEDGPKRLFVVFSERVQQLQFYWNQCGFSISTEDIFLLACSLDRLQTHPSIMQCRFWGVINGLRAPYYIVEASLTKPQIHKRLEQMEDELRERLQAQLKREKCQPEMPAHIGPELTPGFYGWENYDADELARMLPHAAPIPLPRPNDDFDIPPEMIGSGLNRFSYFVVNSLTDDWLELPIVTPKQIAISRQIKKFFTGDLEADVCSYPCFPGKEKHYLRAMIARITNGTTIAPRGYYRKMTRLERRLYEGSDDDGEEEEEEEEEEEANEGEEEEEHEIDNDLLPLRNEKYVVQPLEEITLPVKWVHVRPYILKQGRVVWFDVEKAQKERERELARLRKLEMAEEMGEDEEVEEEEDEEADGEEELDELEDKQEYGPRIFTNCGSDKSDQFTVPWTSRFTSQHANKVERVLVMRSNVWPGAFSFTFGQVCETIYMGWGHKYVARNMAFHHLPLIVDEYPHGTDHFIETTDPTVADEEAYRMWLLSKEKHPILDVGTEGDGEGDDDDDDDDDDGDVTETDG